MNLRMPFLTVTVLVQLALVVGCGQDAATCSTVCPTGSSVTCTTACNAEESACTSASATTDFQALLTCIGNAGGSYTSLPPLCQTEADTVTKNCGGAVGH